MPYAQAITDGTAYTRTLGTGPTRQLKGAPSTRAAATPVSTSNAYPIRPLSCSDGGSGWDVAENAQITPKVRSVPDVGPIQAATAYYGSQSNQMANDPAMFNQTLRMPSVGGTKHRTLTPNDAARLNLKRVRTVTNPLTGATEHQYQRNPPAATGDHHRLNADDLSRTSRVLVGKLGYDPSAAKVVKRERRQEYSRLQGSDSTNLQAATASRMRAEQAERANRAVRLNRNGEHPHSGTGFGGGGMIRSQAGGPTGYVGNKEGGYNALRFAPYCEPQWRGLGDRDAYGAPQAQVYQPMYRDQQVDQQRLPHITAKSDGGPGGAPIGQTVRGADDRIPTMRSYTEDILAIPGPGGDADVGSVVRGQASRVLGSEVDYDPWDHAVESGPQFGSVVRGNANHRLDQQRSTLPPHLSTTHGVDSGPLAGSVVRGNADHRLDQQRSALPPHLSTTHGVESGTQFGSVVRGNADHRLDQQRSTLPPHLSTTHGVNSGPLAGSVVRGADDRLDQQRSTLPPHLSTTHGVESATQFGSVVRGADDRIAQTRAQYDQVDIPSYFRPADIEKSGPAWDRWELDHDRRVADQYQASAGKLAQAENQFLPDGSVFEVSRMVTAQGNPNEGQRSDGHLPIATGPELHALEEMVTAQGKAIEGAPGARSFVHGGPAPGTAPGASYLARCTPQSTHDSTVNRLRHLSTDVNIYKQQNPRLRSQNF